MGHAPAGWSSSPLSPPLGSWEAHGGSHPHLPPPALDMSTLSASVLALPCSQVMAVTEETNPVHSGVLDMKVLEQLGGCFL